MKIQTVRFLLLITLVFSLLTPSTSVHAAGVLFVKSGGTGGCTSWTDACSLQTALAAAVSGDQIWVMTGIYKPTTVETDRSATFQLIEGVVVYGGFAGGETASSQRNPAANVTILSGDIDNNDSQKPIITDLTTVAGNATNSNHVVTGAPGATLDSFTITAGNANGPYPSISGGGMLSQNSYVSLTLMNITFIGNSAQFGGGMYSERSSPTLTNVTFSGNSATYGGGLGVYSGVQTLTNVTFSGNSAIYGGGMQNSSSSPILTNVTFSDNSATLGGGMYNEGYTWITVMNTIFWGNTAVPDGGAQIYNTTAYTQVDHSVVQDGCPGSYCYGNITADPKLGTLGNYGGSTQTIPLQPSSSAIDTGDDDTCAADDQRGIPRPQGAHCDIGAYEYTAPPTVLSSLRANPNPTNAASVNFIVTFSDSVTGVDMSDFDLTTAGVLGASLTGVSGSGSVYTVTVNTGSGTGTIRLDVVDNDSILSLAFLPLGGAGAGNGSYTSGETYNVRYYQTYLPLIYR